MRPSESNARRVMALAMALGVAALALSYLDDEPDGATTRLVRPAVVSTEATVLGDAVDRSTSLPLAPPASPATIPPTGGGPPAAPATSGTEAAPSPRLAPPVSITSPNPPRTTTTTAPTTTTSEPPATTTTTTTTTNDPQEEPPA